jgi:hypothetical protein
MSDVAALTAAMALVPGLYSRNRMFELFEQSAVRRARGRARMLRGLLRAVGHADADVDLSAAAGGRVALHYKIARLRLERTVQMTEFELSVLRVLLASGPRPRALEPSAADRPRVEEALARLA